MRLSKIFKILLPVLFMLISLSSGAQYLGTFKEIWLTNGDSTLNNQENGGIYYNETTDRFRFREDGVWRGLGSTGSGGNFWPLDGSASITANVNISRGNNDLFIGDAEDLRIDFNESANLIRLGHSSLGAVATGEYSPSTGITFRTQSCFNCFIQLVSNNHIRFISDDYIEFGGVTLDSIFIDPAADIPFITNRSTFSRPDEFITRQFSEENFWNLTEDFALSPSTDNNLIVTGNSGDTLRFNDLTTFKIEQTGGGANFTVGRFGSTVGNNVRGESSDGSFFRVGGNNLGGAIIIQGPENAGVQPDSTLIEFAVNQPANDGMLSYNRLTEDYSMGFNGGTGSMSLAQVNLANPTTDFHATTKNYVDGLSSGQASGSLTDGAPTETELNGIIGTAATNGAGYRTTVIDTDGTGSVYLIVSDGADYHFQELTQAAP